MSANANAVRDVFAFSRRGARALSAYALVPVVADDAINRALDHKRHGQHQGESSERPPLTLVFEDFLARHFASGCREAA